MKRAELLAAVAVSCAMIAGALAWRFGVYGLLGAGSVYLAALLMVDPIDLVKRPKGPNGKD